MVVYIRAVVHFHWNFKFKFFNLNVLFHIFPHFLNWAFISTLGKITESEMKKKNLLINDTSSQVLQSTIDIWFRFVHLLQHFQICSNYFSMLGFFFLHFCYIIISLYKIGRHRKREWAFFNVFVEYYSAIKKVCVIPVELIAPFN